MSSPTHQDTTDLAVDKPKTWVQFEEEEEPSGPALPTPLPAPPKRSSTPDNKLQKNPETNETITVNVNDIINDNDDDNNIKSNNEYSGAVITTESIQLNLDRSGLSRSISPDSPDNNVPNELRVPEPKSASLKTIDLRGNNNGRNDINTVMSTPIGNIRSGFANGDTIVTLLPVNTRWPWVTPANFRPELVPEELMAQGLTVSKKKISLN